LRKKKEKGHDSTIVLIWQFKSFLICRKPKGKEGRKREREEGDFFLVPSIARRREEEGEPSYKPKIDSL